MATTTPLTDAINALTTYANSVTGGSDADLSSAVATLASGYGGGSSIQSGSFTPSSNSKTFTVEVDESTTNFCFYATDFNAGTADAGWHCVGGIWFNNYATIFMRYNETNSGTGTASASLSGTTLTFTGQYVVRTEKTYLWYAW